MWQEVTREGIQKTLIDIDALLQFHVGMNATAELNIVPPEPENGSSLAEAPTV
jgi:hypothetical protein